MSKLPDNLLPQQSKESERAVLGCCLRLNTNIGDVLQVLKVEDFYQDAHQKIFRRMVALWDQGKKVDAVTLAEALKASGELEDAGSYQYLGELWEASPSGFRAADYAEVVREKSILRSLHYAAVEMVRDVFDPKGPADEVLAQAEQKIFAIAQGGVIGNTVHIREVVKEAYDQMDAAKQKKEIGSSVATGLIDVDAKTAGLQNSELVILAARPSVGKTSLGLCMLLHAAVKKRLPVFFASLEQTRLELTHRMLANLSGVPYTETKHGTLTPDAAKLITEAGSMLQDSEIFVDDAAGQTVLRISANARRLKARYGIKLVVIDYLQLIEPDDRRVNRQEQVGAISRRLKHVAREMQVPVICLAQLNREVEHRQGAEPRLADLRDSGEIEQNADVVMLLHPDSSQENVVGLNIAKQRNGPCGKVSLYFRKELFRFENYSEPFGAYKAGK